MRFRVWDNFQHMQTFVARLRRLAQIPGLLGLGAVVWALAEVLHTGSFIVESADRVTGFFFERPVITCVAAVLWLFMWMVWPDIRKAYPGLRFPKTIHEKVHDLTVTHSGLVSEVATLVEGGIATLTAVSTLNTTLSERIAESARGVQDSINGRLRSIEHSLVVHSERVNELEGFVKVVRDGQLALRGDIHGAYLPYLLDITQLMSEATSIIEGLINIGTLHPDSAEAALPFSKDWSKARSTIAGTWALSVNDHLKHCTNFAKAYGVPELVVVDQGFKSRIWSTQEPREKCLGWLQVQWAQLSTARRKKITEDPIPQFSAPRPQA